MARGIDTAAHCGALPTGTVGVVADGVDMIYLPENANLFEQAAATGLLLAEMPPSAPEWTDGMRQTIDQPAVNNLRESLLRDLSFDWVTTDDLTGWYAQPAPVVCAAILELKIACLVTRHYGNRVARIA
jgi:predicted Rossmann fold nucleotide-binding protein DprA/Smf involved in DNA uptake